MSKAMLKHCPYCKLEAEVTGMAMRAIMGYKNHLTGKNVAMVEHLSCGHEYVDNKFNVDSLYFTMPNPSGLSRDEKQLEKAKDDQLKTDIPKPQQHYPVSQPRGGLTVMDIACLICTVFLAFTVPPLVVIPILYFAFRLK